MPNQSTGSRVARATGVEARVVERVEGVRAAAGAKEVVVAMDMAHSSLRSDRCSLAGTVRLGMLHTRNSIPRRIHTDLRCTMVVAAEVKSDYVACECGRSRKACACQ